MKNLKVVFMGTPEFATPVLNELIKSTNVVLVVTQPDKYVGRKKMLTESPVKILAKENNIEVFTPNKIKEDYQRIVDLQPDIIITCAYGQIIPHELIVLPKYKCVNVHASLLPKYRGGAPIARAIMNGDKVTGITIMYMSDGMDDGNILYKQELEIKDEDDINSLSDKLSVLGAKLLMESLPNIIDGSVQEIEQDEKEVTFAYVPKRDEELIDFNKSAFEVNNKIRALKPYAYALLDNQELKIVSSIPLKDEFDGNPGEIVNVDKEAFYVKCKEGTLKVLEITPFSKKTMTVKSYFNGLKKESLVGKCLNETVI